MALACRAGSDGRARIADHHAIVKTGPASMLAFMSAAMPEQIEKSHSSPFSAEQHSSAVSHSERRISALEQRFWSTAISPDALPDRH
jgi:hypothetical protein